MVLRSSPLARRNVSHTLPTELKAGFSGAPVRVGNPKTANKTRVTVVATSAETHMGRMFRSRISARLRSHPINVASTAAITAALTGLIGRLRMRTKKERAVNAASGRGISVLSTTQSPPHHAANAAAVSRPLVFTTAEMNSTIGESATIAPRSGSLRG